MKYVNEFRDPEAAKKLALEISRVTTQPWTIMEVCGGQTHAIVKSGLDQLLPESLTLLHGPGCPVCVTAVELVDKAIEIASRPNVIFCSFGDMLRVPGTGKDLLSVKAEGGDVRTVYSPLDAIKIARENPSSEVVFFAVGFETTAPTTAMAIHQASQEEMRNFTLLVSHVLVPPALEAILASPTNRVQGFLAPGHVCTVMGYWEYDAVAGKHGTPIVVTGFEPLDLLQGIHRCVDLLEKGEAKVANEYKRVVRREGNVPAQEMIRKIFRVVNRKWRGVGEIPASGLGLREEFEEFDAETRFGVASLTQEESAECISGLILRGEKKPGDCEAFGTRCTPEHPLGATMVSSEGACAAYYRYR
jgi:hydrogenase expression/formation protein HypD